MKNKVVIITGASSGIGKACAWIFAQAGAQVVLASRNLEKLNLVCKELQEDGFTALSVQADVSKEADCQRLISEAIAAFQGVDVLINNAGITSDQIFLRMKDEEWDKVIDTNLNGVFNLTKIFVKNMIKNKKGRIINISSISGLMGNPGQVNYSSSKSALNGFTKSLAKELGSRNITVNCVAPGYIDTDMTSFLDEDSKKQIEKSIPLGRLGSGEDISKLVAFLASDEASYITGQTISIDGGLLMY